MSTLHVSFRLGPTEFVVPASQVLHLESFDRATPIPGAETYVAGLVQVRGRLVPVVDLRIRFGIAGSAEGIDRRVIVVQVGARVAGLLVDSAREVVKIDPAAFQPPPDLVEQQAPGFVKAVASLASRLVLLIDISRAIGATGPNEELTHA